MKQARNLGMSSVMALVIAMLILFAVSTPLFTYLETLRGRSAQQSIVSGGETISMEHERINLQVFNQSTVTGNHLVVRVQNNGSLTSEMLSLYVVKVSDQSIVPDGSPIGFSNLTLQTGQVSEDMVFDGANKVYYGANFTDKLVTVSCAGPNDYVVKVATGRGNVFSTRFDTNFLNCKKPSVFNIWVYLGWGSVTYSNLTYAYYDKQDGICREALDPWIVPSDADRVVFSFNLSNHGRYPIVLTDLSVVELVSSQRAAVKSFYVLDSKMNSTNTCMNPEGHEYNYTTPVVLPASLNPDDGDAGPFVTVLFGAVGAAKDDLYNQVVPSGSEGLYTLNLVIVGYLLDGKNSPYTQQIPFEAITVT